MAPSILEKRKRQAARVALYASLATLIVIVAVLGQIVGRRARLDTGWGEQNLEAAPEVRLLRDYVRIDTTRGKEILGAEFLAEQLAAAGIEVTIEPLGDGRANLWAVLEGEDPDALVLHHHIDVWDPGDIDEWLFPPFDADIEGPWLYGRGAFDMKSYAIAQLTAFLEVAALDRPLRRSLILLATSDEEVGSALGTRWVLSQHPELVNRFWGVLTEGGIVEALNPDDIKYWGIENAQLQVLPVEVCSPSRERLEMLVEDLDSWLARDTPLHLTPELLEFSRTYAPTRSQRRARNHMGRPEFMLRNRWGYDHLPQYTKLLFRNRTAAWDIEANPGGGYSVSINLLLVPGSDPVDAVAELLPSWITHGLDVAVGQPLGASHGSPTDHPLFQAAVESLQRAYPQSAAGGVFLPWTVTDSRFFRARGIPSYGYSPFLFFSTDTVRVDRINERIPLPGFVSGVRLYSEMVQAVVVARETDN